MKPLTAAATGMTNIKLGSTFSNDQLPEMRFDLQFVNPPDGYEWSKDFDAVTNEAARGFDGRFGAGLPRKSDGQKLIEAYREMPSGELRFPNGTSVTSTFALRPSSFAPALPGQLFSSRQIPVCLWFLEKNKHDGTVVENELATAIMNLALRGIEGRGQSDGGIGQSPRRERV